MPQTDVFRTELKGQGNRLICSLAPRYGGEVKKGDTFTYKNLLFTVLEYENFRIERLGIEVKEEKEDISE